MRPIKVEMRENHKKIFSGEFDTLDDCVRDCMSFLMRRYPNQIFKDLIKYLEDGAI